MLPDIQNLYSHFLFFNITFLDDAVRKHLYQPCNTTLDHMNTGKFQRTKKTTRQS